MKEKMIVPTWGYVFLLIVIFVPFLYVYAMTAQWSPFTVKGSLFLQFYGICLGGSCLSILLPRLFDSLADFYVPLKWLFIFMLVLGLARLCQGIYHHKPVGYLVLMLIAEWGVWQLGKMRYNEKR